MNSLRTPRSPRQAVRQGPVHVSVVVARLLAMYGITEEISLPPPTHNGPLQRERDRSGPAISVEYVKANQQTFPWFAPAESHA